MSTPESADRSVVLPAAVEIYDTTLRDGAQLEGISLTVADKLHIAEQLDRLGVHYIEGGWPGANPKDEEFFARARSELTLERSQMVAFGSTRRVNGDAAEDPTLANLLARLEEADESTPVPVGVFRAIDKPTYDGLLDEQVAAAREQPNAGDMAALLAGSETWTVK